MSNLFRSANILLRTSRYALQRRPVNPVYNVLRQNPAAFRGMATVFERTKPHVNIGKFSKIAFSIVSDIDRYYRSR